MDGRISWEKHVKSICSKVTAGIGTMIVPLSTLKMRLSVNLLLKLY